jgi:hypothetical protein
MSAAGPPRGCLRERGPAKARTARLRARAAADLDLQREKCNGAEAASNYSPSECSAVAYGASVGAHVGTAGRPKTAQLHSASECSAVAYAASVGAHT